jgi:glyoxylase-like metal-dependent hydrolase (beta-lactamase superfamily II)
MAADPLVRHDVSLIRAGNPGPFTLEGTNTWVLGREPAWVVDPGPSLDAHVSAVVEEVAARGGLGGVALTHGHGDHTGALPALLAEAGPAPVAAMDAAVASGGGTAAGQGVVLADGDSFGPFLAVATPGHSPDHLAFVAGSVCFTGDAVLGRGSVFVAPAPGALAGYLASLQRLRGLPLDLLCPGHGPVVDDPAAKLDEYVAHRLDRERRLLDALGRGLRTEEELLDDVWDDAPPGLRPAAATTLRAHLGKLSEEGQLPGGVDFSFDDPAFREV